MGFIRFTGVVVGVTVGGAKVMTEEVEVDGPGSESSSITSLVAVAVEVPFLCPLSSMIIQSEDLLRPCDWDAIRIMSSSSDSMQMTEELIFCFCVSKGEFRSDLKGLWTKPVMKEEWKML